MFQRDYVGAVLKQQVSQRHVCSLSVSLYLRRVTLLRIKEKRIRFLTCSPSILASHVTVKQSTRWQRKHPSNGRRASSKAQATKKEAVSAKRICPQCDKHSEPTDYPETYELQWIKQEQCQLQFEFGIRPSCQRSTKQTMLPRSRGSWQAFQIHLAKTE
jgi:hypothetical protein